MSNQNSPSSTVARNRYRNGRAFEYKVRDHFKARGFLVFRSAGSKGPADIIAIPPKDMGKLYERTQLIQCKRDGKISKEERSELISLARTYDCDAVLCYLAPNPLGGRKQIVAEEVLL